jgi:hypothetical protein
MADPPCHSPPTPIFPRARGSDPFAGLGATTIPATCQPGHHGHRSPERGIDPTALDAAVEYMRAHVQALRLTAEGTEETELVVPDDERARFRQTATAWELDNSRILNLVGRWMPIVDDADLVVAYARYQTSTGVHWVHIADIEGHEIHAFSIGEIGLQDDPIGNELVAIVATLGIAAIVRGVSSGLARRAAEGVIRGATAVTISVARLAGPGVARVTLLVLRSMRARSLVAGLRRSGTEVIVNIGGEAGSEEVARFGAHQIALNAAVRFRGRRVANLVKEPGEAIGDVFLPNSIDRVVARRLDASFDVTRVAQGAFRVLRPGGRLGMELFPASGNPAFAAQFRRALTDAGFTVLDRPPGLGTAPLTPDAQRALQWLVHAVKP